MIVTSQDSDFENYKSVLEKMKEGNFPFHSVIEIVPKESNPIIDPDIFYFSNNRKGAN